MQKLRKHLKSRKYDQVERDKNKDTPLHAIVRFKRRDKHELLLVLMVYSDFGTEEIEIPDADGNTALHIAMFVSYKIICPTVNVQCTLMSLIISLILLCL